MSEAVYDPVRFASLVDDVGEETSRAALRLFFTDTEARLDHLDDAMAVLRLAHTVKSSAAAFGFDHLSALARRLEQDAPGLASTDLAARIDEFRSAFVSVRTLIP